MRVLLDVDGVLADLVGELCRRFPEMREEQVTEFEFAKCALPVPVRSLYEAMEEPGFAASLAWYPGAKDAVHAILAKGHEVAFCTSPMKTSPTWMWERQEWLRAAFPDLPVIFAQRKQWVAGDVLVDDREQHCDAFAEAGGESFLIMRPWNTHARRLTWDLAEVVRVL